MIGISIIKSVGMVICLYLVYTIIKCTIDTYRERKYKDEHPLLGAFLSLIIFLTPVVGVALIILGV